MCLEQPLGFFSFHVYNGIAVKKGTIKSWSKEDI